VSIASLYIGVVALPLIAIFLIGNGLWYVEAVGELHCLTSDGETWIQPYPRGLADLYHLLGGLGVVGAIAGLIVVIKSSRKFIGTALLAFCIPFIFGLRMQEMTKCPSDMRAAHPEEDPPK
jgi:hypothetical protein